tara:strand:+ start:3666 stop:4829 length:1164 start_codon:yes stop_codon:yes gene_type:complete
MSETMKEEPKIDESKEGLKIKKKPKKLVDKMPNNIKVDLSKKQEDAVQTQETDDSNAIIEEKKNETSSEKVVEEVRATEQEVETPVIEEIKEEVKETTKELKEAIRDEKVVGKPLPENIEKLVSFMEETGGTVEDYVNLNKDYSSYDERSLLNEYYKRTKPHLNQEEINFLMEDSFSYDEEVDEDRVVRKRQLLFKEEIAKAKNFLESSKSKYYDEIKLRPGVTQEQQKAMDFFNRYNKEQQIAAERREQFKDNTDKFFNEDFKGFEIKVGEKRFNYKVSNPSATAEKQSDLNKFVKKFLNDKGEVIDTVGYHKAFYAAENVDTIANHFYEQGKADAVKDVIAKSKNINNDPRPQASGDVFINGFKVKAISGVDSSKLKIKSKNNNN